MKVRRRFIFIEESIYEGTQRAVWQQNPRSWATHASPQLDLLCVEVLDAHTEVIDALFFVRLPNRER